MNLLITAEEMKACDRFTSDRIGIPSMVLMERAALSVVDAMLAENYDLSKTLVVCSTGNNGGDGLAIARLLHLKQLPVTILLLGNQDQLSVDAQQQLNICRYYQIPVVTEVESMSDFTMIVDAIFGIGLDRAVQGKMVNIIEDINEAPAQVVAVDLPSGVACNDGAVLGIAVRADLTVTFAFNKIGLTLNPGMKYAGKVVVADIGIYDDALREAQS